MSCTEARAGDGGHSPRVDSPGAMKGGDSRVRLPLGGNVGSRRALGAKLSVLSVSWQPRSDSGAIVKGTAILHGQLALGKHVKLHQFAF